MSPTRHASRAVLLGMTTLPRTTSVAVLATLLAGCTDGLTSLAGRRRPDFLLVASPNTFAQVSAEDDATCALRSDGVVECWGASGYGEAPATKAAASGTFVQVDIGDNGGPDHTCALRSDGVVECWGNNDFGQAPATKSAASGTFTQVAVGTGWTCAVRSDGVVECWGFNGQGQAPATKSAASGTLVQLSAGVSHACALRGDGVVECWGYNFHGQAPATKSAAGDGFTQVSAGGQHTCALRGDGVVECWGSPDGGQYPPLDFGQAPASKSAASGTFTQVSAHRYHTCALRNDGVIECWGDNSHGEAPATKTAANGSFTQVYAGGAYTCAVRSDGVVECWGFNHAGQAPATRTAGSTTVRVLPTATFTFPGSVPAGNAFTLSLTDAQVPGQPEATSFTFAFDCGDGSGYGAFGTSNTASCPTSAAATRAVKGKVKDQDDDATEYTGTVLVTNRPVANAGSPQSGDEGSSVTFDASGSSDPDGDALITFKWDFGDGTVVTVSTPTVQHTYADNKPGGGAYPVKLTVTDSKGATSAEATTSADIRNIAPTATFNPASPVGEGSFTLALTAVQDAPGDVGTLEYAFDCGGGAGYGAFGSSASTTCQAPDNGAARTVRAKVRDKDGGESAYTGSVTVENVAPTVAITSAPPTVKVKTTYTLQISFSDPGSADAPWMIQTNWGDGKKPSTQAASAPGSVTQTHTYTGAGTYTITVRVTDKDGGTNTATTTVTVEK